MFSISPQSLFFNQNQGISLKPVVAFGTVGEDVVLSETAIPLFPMLIQELTGKLFLLTEEGTDRSSEMRTVVLGRFAPNWESVPVVERAFALMLDGRYSEVAEEWSNLPLTRLTGELAGYFGTKMHSTVFLRVSPEEIWSRLQNSGYHYSVRQDRLVHAILSLPVHPEELELFRYLASLLAEDLNTTRESMRQCEIERQAAVRAFEETIDKMMLKLQLLRDRERLHQAWLQANPEPLLMALATEPPAV